MNVLIDWVAELETGIDEIDKQHKVLVRMINNLHQAILKDETESAIKMIVHDMVVYVQMHFQTEEDLMDKYDYPLMALHKQEHSKFVAKTLDFKEASDRSEENISYKVMDYLQSWLVSHILDTDKNLGRYLLGKGV